MDDLKNFIKSRPKPSMNRDKAKYYPEIQQLAFNLMRYLNMNDNPNEHPCQGNYNMTYLEENMTKEEFYHVVARFIRRLNQNELIQIIKKYTGSEWGKPVIDQILEMENFIKQDEENKYLIEVKLKNGTYEWFESDNDVNLMDKITDLKQGYEPDKITLYERKFEVK